MVGGEHEQHVRIVVGNHLAVAVDRIRIPLVPAALGITEVGMQDPQPAARTVEIPGPAVGKLLRQFMRLVLLDHPDVADPTVEAIRQGEVDQPVSAGKGEGWLSAFVGQGTKAAAFSAREHERQNARSVHLKAVRSAWSASASGNSLLMARRWAYSRSPMPATSNRTALPLRRLAAFRPNDAHVAVRTR